MLTGGCFVVIDCLREVIGSGIEFMLLLLLLIDDDYL
jgi:hypothetical protein